MATVKTKPSVFYAIRTVAGRELDVALMMENRAKSIKQHLDVRSIIVPPEIKGYVIIEASGVHVVYPLIKDIKYVKGRAFGIIKFEEIEKLVKPKPIIEMIREGDIVEIIAGPFRGMRAKVISVNRSKNEITVNVMESEFPLPIVIPAEFVKPMRRSE